MLNIQTPPAEFNCLLQAAFFLQLGLAKTCGRRWELITFIYSNSTQWYKPILRFSIYHQVAMLLLYWKSFLSWFHGLAERERKKNNYKDFTSSSLHCLTVSIKKKLPDPQSYDIHYQWGQKNWQKKTRCQSKLGSQITGCPIRSLISSSWRAGWPSGL